MAIQEESSEPRSNLTAASPDFFFEVEMISIEDDDLEMGNLEDLEEQ
jgi:hypothetical protein